MGLFRKARAAPTPDPRAEYLSKIEAEAKLDDVVRRALSDLKTKGKHQTQIAAELGSMRLGFQDAWSPDARRENEHLARELSLPTVLRGHEALPVPVLQGVMHFLGGKYLEASEVWLKAEAAQYPPAMVLMAMVRAHVPDMWRENMRNLSSSDRIRRFIDAYLAFERRRLAPASEKLSMYSFDLSNFLRYITYFLDVTWTGGSPTTKERFEAYATDLAADLRVAGLRSRRDLYEITVKDTRTRYTGLPAHITPGGHVVRCVTAGENCEYARREAHLDSEDDVELALLRYDYWARWALGSFDFESGRSGATGTLLHVFDPYFTATFHEWENLLRSLPRETKLQVEDGTTFMSDGRGGLLRYGVDGILISVGMTDLLKPNSAELYDQVFWLLTLFGGRVLGTGRTAFELGPDVHPPLPLHSAIHDTTTGGHVWTQLTPT